MVADFLEEYYPIAAPWERQSAGGGAAPVSRGGRSG